MKLGSLINIAYLHGKLEFYFQFTLTAHLYDLSGNIRRNLFKRTHTVQVTTATTKTNWNAPTTPT